MLDVSFWNVNMTIHTNTHSHKLLVYTYMHLNPSVFHTKPTHMAAVVNVTIHASTHIQSKPEKTVSSQVK